MIHTTRQAFGHAVRISRTHITTQKRNATSLTSAIKLSSFPAPHTGTIAVLSLNRGRARNALGISLLGELNGVVEGLHAEKGNGSTRALIIASESDDAFCAGADLKERLDMSLDEVREFLKRLRTTFTRLSTLPIPTISAVSSIAFGGGLELALATNFRVFASSTTVSLPETKLGIIPGAGATYRLPALIGESRAQDLILTGRRVDGPEAYFLGLCNRLVEVSEDELAVPGIARAKVLEEAMAMATDICDGAPVAMKAAMQAVASPDRGEATENKAYDLILPTQDRVAALRAFVDKRERPAFQGR